MRSRWQLTIAIVLSSVLAVAPAASQETLAVVNGEVIAKEALVRHLLDLSTVGRAQLEEMINEALLFQAAQSLGITATDAEIDARAAEIKGTLDTQDAFKRYLADQQVTAQGLGHKLRVKILVEKLLADKAKVTDEEVTEVYEANRSRFETPETVTLRAILTKTKERADEAFKRLDQGEDFAAVASALSEHEYTAKRGGLLGRVTRANLSSVLAQAAFAAEVGSYTQLIEAEDGFYILKVEARSPATSRSFDDVKESIRTEISEMRLQQAWVVWLEEAREQASIERKWPP